MRLIPALALILLLASTLAIAAGTALVYPPAGLIVAGLEGMAVAYGVLYVHAKKKPGRS